jgi:hypothetical protein
MDTCYTQRQRDRRRVAHELMELRRRSVALIRDIRENDWNRWEADDRYDALWRDYDQASRAAARIVCTRLLNEWRATTSVVRKVYEFIELRR